MDDLQPINSGLLLVMMTMMVPALSSCRQSWMLYCSNVSDNPDLILFRKLADGGNGFFSNVSVQHLGDFYTSPSSQDDATVDRKFARRGERVW